MRKIKVDLQCRVPSWNFCNHDGFTADNRYSKDLCRFCQKSKDGYRCLLYDATLTADPNFVHKTACCINATATSAVTTIDEPVAIKPQLIIKESLKLYKKTLAGLLKQGYPYPLAEQVATEYTINNK